MMSETQNIVHSEKLDEEIGKLKEQLTLFMTKLDMQQQAYMVKVSQDQQSKEKELLKALEQWKDEEKERQKAQMEEMREMMLKEFNKLSSMIDLLQDFLFYLNRLHSSAYVEEERNRKVEKLERELQEQKELIISQMEQIKKLTSYLLKLAGQSTEKKVETKNHKSTLRRNQILKELGPLLLQAYLMELEPFYPELNGSTERKQKIQKQTPKSTLRRSPNEMELQYLLEQALVDQLEAMGTSRVPKIKVGSQREKREKQFPKFQRIQQIREKVAQALGLRLKEKTAYLDSEPPARRRWPSGETYLRSLPSNFASSLAQMLSRLGLAQRRVSSFNSEEDSEDEAPAQKPRGAAISVGRPATQPTDSDVEWMEGFDMEETSQVQLNKKMPHSELVTDLMRNLERLFAERASGKPEEGENVLSNKNNMRQKPEYSEKDDDDDDDDDDDVEDDYDDLDSCSLEDHPPLNQPPPVTKGLDSMSTSV